MKKTDSRCCRVVLLGAVALFLGMTPTSESEPEPLAENDLIVSMHESATDYRERYHLNEQELDEDLCKIAQKWANNMANRNVMYHGGGEQVVAYGYSNPEQCIQAWINSPAHRAWVLGRNSKCGFGLQKSWSGRWFYAGVFR